MRLSMCQALWNTKHTYKEIHRKSLKGQIRWACQGASENIWVLLIPGAVALANIL